MECLNARASGKYSAKINIYPNFNCIHKYMWSVLGGSLVTTAWRVLRLRMEGSCEYIE
jgi:hypothetical protein